METVHFTKEGHASLQNELEKLKSVERPKIIEEIATARAHGDLKENAEYHAAREKQGFIEGRIAQLEDSLSRAQVIDFGDQNADTVRFGAWVTLEDEESGEERKFRVVGELEADIENNLLSLGSPMARAVMGKQLDDVVEIKAPNGVKEYVVVGINY